MSYQCTILTAEPGRRLAKLYRDPNEPPEEYDAGIAFDVEERDHENFEGLVRTISRLKADQCIIRGRVRESARELVDSRLVRRLEYPDGEHPAIFERADRSWIVLDLDESDEPFPNAVEGHVKAQAIEAAVEAWLKRQPPEIRRARSAFFLSASSHRSPTLRGKLIVDLAEPLDNASAEAYAKAHGFDPSVSRTVQPNYFAAPIFKDCEDPIVDRRPIRFEGKPARLPRVDAMATVDRELGAREDIGEPVLTDRAADLALALRDRWLEGDRIENNAALHLFGRLLHQGWPKAEVAGLLEILDDEELDAAKVREHWHILGNARPIDGWGGAKEWLGEHFGEIDRIVNHDPIVEAVKERRRERLAADPGDVDPWDRCTDFTKPIRPLEYACEGLRLASSKGKISIIGGQPKSSKGPLLDHLAICFALGLPAFGEFGCQQLPTLLLDCEGEYLTQIRVRRMMRAIGRDPAELTPDKLRHVDASGFGDLTSEAHLLRLERFVDDGGYRVIGLDSYTSAMIMNEADQNSSQYARLAHLLGRLGVLVIAVTHSNKASADREKPTLRDLSGNGALGAFAQTVIMPYRPNEDDEFKVRIACGRAPETPFAPIDIEWVDNADGSLGIRRIEIEENFAPSAREIERIARHLADAERNADKIRDFVGRADTYGTGVEISKICKTIGLSRTEWSAARDQLLKRGEISESTLPGRQGTVVRMTSPGLEGV